MQFIPELLRIVCGFFFIPHAIGKFTAQEAAFGFFASAGFKPPQPYAYSAMVLELLLAAALIGGWHLEVVGWIAMVYLFIATGAVIKVEKKWLWHIGGCEYPFFWGLCCGIVAASHTRW